MRRVVTIVEGDGEVAAVPELLRRLAGHFYPGSYVEVPRPIRVRRDQFLNVEREFTRHLQLAAMKAGRDGAVLVLLDADDDCPAELGPRLLDKARLVVPHCRIRVVLANRDYESWFMAAAESLAGARGFPEELVSPENPEVPRDAKGWVSERMGGYDPCLDQAALTARFDIGLAMSRSPSFDKLCRDFRSIIDD